MKRTMQRRNPLPRRVLLAETGTRGWRLGHSTGKSGIAVGAQREGRRHHSKPAPRHPPTRPPSEALHGVVVEVDDGRVELVLAQKSRERAPDGPVADDDRPRLFLRVDRTRVDGFAGG